MIGLFWFAFWALLAALALAAGMRAHARRQDMFRGQAGRIDDDAVRAIVETGALSVDVDEPLDMREIDAEAERFWSETWDEPEEV